MNKKTEMKADFDEFCQRYIERNGTLRTHGVALAPEARLKIDRMYAIGVSRAEVHAILVKYGQFLD